MMLTGECIYLLAQVLFWWSCLLYRPFIFWGLMFREFQSSTHFASWRRMWLANGAFYWTTCCWGVFKPIIYFFFSEIYPSRFELVSVGLSRFQSTEVDFNQLEAICLSRLWLFLVISNWLHTFSVVYSWFRLFTDVFSWFQKAHFQSTSVIKKKASWEYCALNLIVREKKFDKLQKRSNELNKNA